MLNEMKKPMVKNLTLYPPQGMAHMDWSRRCAIHIVTEGVVVATTDATIVRDSGLFS